jgi:3-oxoacyl-[acyl-carrier protein] reductase
MNKSLQGEIALVTGASRGIGAAIADELASLGATVIGTATSEAGAAAIGERLAAHGGHGRALDVTDGQAVEALMDGIAKELGAVSILVNNAGITKDGLFVRMSDDAWDQVLEVNLTAVFRLTRELAHPMMKRRHGRIINITSVVGVSGNPGQANYCASKAGMIGFSKSLAQEIAPRNITVNCVAPGFIESAMTEKLNDKQKEAIMGAIPMRRMGSGAEIASAVTYLASNEASYVTGQTIHVNGGMLMV